jgi:hypothetical protein
MDLTAADIEYLIQNPDALGDFNKNFSLETTKEDVDYMTKNPSSISDFMAQASDRHYIEAMDESAMTDYLLNSAKLGVTDTVSLLSTIGDTFIIDPIVGIYDEIIGDRETNEATISNVLGDISSRGLANFKKNVEYSSRLTGADPEMKAPGDSARILGMGVRFAADPLGYVGLPLKWASAITAPLKMTGIGVATEVGGDIGDEAESRLFNTNTGTGRLIGSIGTGLAVPFMTKPVSVAIGAAASKAKDTTIGRYATSVAMNTLGKSEIAKKALGKFTNLNADYDNASRVLSSGAAKSILEMVAKEEGIKNIPEIITEFNKISNKVVGRDVPLIVAMSKSPVIAEHAHSLAKRDPVFRQRVNEELRTLTANIDQYATKIFGMRYAEIPNYGNLSSEIAGSMKHAKKRVAKYDKEIHSLHNRIKPSLDETTTGNIIKGLVEKRQKAVLEQMSPLYDDLKIEAKKANAVMPASSTESLYNFVVQNKLNDIWGKGTKLDKKIMASLRPVKDGKKLAYKQLSFDNVDSLKRAINELKRKPLSRSEQRSLMNLEDVFDDARKSIPGNFSERLAALDSLYYQKLGIPLNRQGIKEISAKKYAEQIAPILLKNKTAMNDFLNIGGNAGQEIARNAVLSQLHKSFVKDGAVNLSGVKGYMHKKADVIDMVPGLRRELNGVILDGKGLLVKKAVLDQQIKKAEKEISNNFLLNSPEYGADTHKIAKMILNDHTKWKKIKEDLSKVDPSISKAVNDSIRNEVVQIARAHNSGAMNFLTDPRNEKIIGEIMSPGYVTAAKNLAKMTDAVNIAKVEKLAYSKSEDVASKIAGVDVGYIASTIRQPLTSANYKAIRLMSKLHDVSEGSRVDEAIVDLLLDPKGMTRLSETLESLGGDKAGVGYFRKLTDVIGAAVPRYIYAASKESMIHAADELPNKEQVAKPQLPMPELQRPDFGASQAAPQPRVQDKGIMLPPSMRNPRSTLGKAVSLGGIGSLNSSPIASNSGVSSLLGGSPKERTDDIQATLSRINSLSTAPILDVENETYQNY